MIVAQHQARFPELVPHIPQRHVKLLRTHAVGVLQYGIVALAMFSVSAVAGVLAGIVVGVLG